MKRLIPDLALLLAATLWGATFTLVKKVVETLSAEAFLFWRFLVAACLLLVIAGAARSFSRQGLRYGAALGVFLVAGFWLQTRGLVITTPARSAFLTALAVVLVPLFDYAFYRERVTRAALIATFVAFGGVAVMVGGIRMELNAGDVLTVGCAIAFAIHLILTARASRAASALGLTAVQVSVVAIAFAPVVAARPLERVGRSELVGILVSAILTTVVTFLLLTWAQARVSATEAAVILSFEPVAAAITSIGFYGEPPTANLLVGGGMIVAAMILAQTR